MKCEVLAIGGSPAEKAEAHHDISQLLPHVALIAEAELHLLGAPIRDTAIGSHLHAKLRKFNDMCSPLGSIDPQSALYLLRHSLSAPRLVYFLRCCRAFNWAEELNIIDDFFKKILENILNVTIDTERWEQVSLPIYHGGLGVRSVLDLSTSAYTSSLIATENLIKDILPKSRHLGLGREIAAQQAQFQVDNENLRKQKFLDELICSKKRTHYSKQRQNLFKKPVFCLRAIL